MRSIRRVAIVVAGCAALIACNGGESTETQATGAATEQTTASGAPAQVEEQAAFAVAATDDGSYVCPSSGDCPEDPNGNEYSGIVIDETASPVAGENIDRSQTITCVANRAGQSQVCPAGYHGRIWKPAREVQTVCVPGATGSPCNQVRGKVAFLCRHDAPYCPGVPGKRRKNATGDSPTPQ